MANSSVPSASFTIAKSITGTNYSWTVGKAVDYTGATVTLPLGPSYDLVVCRSDNTMCTGSPKQFTLTPAPTATFQVLSTIPSKLALGAVVDITWSDSDTTATNYHLLLRTPTGKQYWIFVGPPTSVSADGVRHYSWTAGTVVNNIQANPTMPTFPGSYFITVCHAYAGKCVYSNTFSVSSNSSAVNKKINQLAVINRALEKLLLLLKN